MTSTARKLKINKAIDANDNTSSMKTIEGHLSNLDEFHKFYVLQQLLRKSLEAKS